MSRELFIIIFDKNNLSSELTEIYLKELGYVKEIKTFSNYIEGYEVVNRSKPDIVIVDITENKEFGLEVCSKLSKQKIPVIVTSMDTSTTIIIKTLRAGASEFLAKPVLKNELFAAIEKFLQSPKDEQNEDSKIISVFSGKGGSGKTTIAVNLALELAKQTDKKVALVDMNFCMGEAATFLNSNIPFNFSNILENIDNIDKDTMPKMFEKYRDNELYLISESFQGESLSSITFNRISRFFKYIKEIFSYIIVDLPTAADEKVFKTLQQSDYILYVSAVNYNALKNTKNCIDLLLNKGITKDKIKILLNRYIENDELSCEELERELGLEIYKKIPNNYFTVMSAINKGISIPEENINSNVAESFRELAIMLSDSIMEINIKDMRGIYEYQSAD